MSLFRLPRTIDNYNILRVTCEIAGSIADHCWELPSLCDSKTGPGKAPLKSGWALVAGKLNSSLMPKTRTERVGERGRVLNDGPESAESELPRQRHEGTAAQGSGWFGSRQACGKKEAAIDVVQGAAGMTTVLIVSCITGCGRGTQSKRSQGQWKVACDCGGCQNGGRGCTLSASKDCSWL